MLCQPNATSDQDYIDENSTDEQILRFAITEFRDLSQRQCLYHEENGTYRTDCPVCRKNSLILMALINELWRHKNDK